MNNKHLIYKCFFNCFANILTWFIFYDSVHYIMIDSACVNVYALLCGWWGALYVGYILKTFSWLTIPVSVFFLMILLFSMQKIGLPIFSYHDLSEELKYKFIIFFIQSMFFSSPIFINLIITTLLKQRSWLKRN